VRRLLRSSPLLAALLCASCATIDSRQLATDGTVHGLPLPNPGSGPTTVSVAPDGTLWFTEGSGNRIGRMNPDGSGYQGYELPHANSAPRIIALGGDGNIWFSEHNGNRMGRITPAGELAEFDIPTPASQPRAIALGSDGNMWFGEFAGGKVGRITPQGVITEFALPTPNSGPRALAGLTATSGCRNSAPARLRA
jgi:virginiamycin B lyase